MIKKEGTELEIQIEELEARLAPDGGETVLPLSAGGPGGGPRPRPGRP
ncbi:MAG: hypothetical protein HY646_17135 [Acidobacteria bacterium]|nr:hypothetical protein [Acidobacteriota bacterium]